MTVDEQGRPEPPIAANEVDTLLGFLDYQRATFEWKCAGLDAAGLNTAVAASTMTLGGMLKHMSLVEDQWFCWVLHAEQPWPPWDNVDWNADRDWDWHSAGDDTPEQLWAMWRTSVDRARERVDAALADGGLDRIADDTTHDDPSPSLRWIVVHMIEEYARHNGHADLIREVVDGETGE